MNGNIVAPKKFASFVVAASDSKAAGLADYVCDGIYDEVEINAAINALPATGGTVLLLEGTYNIGMPIYPLDYTRLVGQGKGTIIKVGNKVESVLIVDAVAGQNTITVSDITGFRVGMDVTIFDDIHTGYNHGENNQILSINSETKVIRLASALKYSYTTANNAVIFSAYNAIECHGKTHITIENLTLDGNKNNNRIGNYDEWQNGVYLKNSHYSVVKDCLIYNFSMVGVLGSHYIDGDYDGSERCLITNNTIYGCNMNAMHFHGLKKSIISGNVCEDGTQAVIYFIESDDNEIIGNVMLGGSNGLMVLASDMNSIIGGTIKSPSGKGIGIASGGGFYPSYNSVVGVNIYDSGSDGINMDSNNSIVEGCCIYSPGESGISIRSGHCAVVANIIKDSSGPGIVTYAASYCNIIGNVIDRTQWGSAININGLNTIVTDNIIHSTSTAGGGPFVTTQADTVVRNNIGFKTENSGTAIVASGTTSIVVNHGLDVTPTADDVSVTPTNNLGTATKFWIDTLTATQFTINVDADPGAGTATFAWRAAVL